MAKSNQPILTIVMPCYGRYDETIRAIESIKHQDINGWEAIIMGDCCTAFQELIDNGYLEKVKRETESKGNCFRYFNANKKCGDYGWQLMNYGLKKARGKYLIFLNNDDLILKTHFRHYLSEIDNTDLDLVYYNTEMFSNYQKVTGWCDIQSYVRDTKFECGFIGHCDIILKTKTIQKFNFQHSGPKMAEDWDLAYFISERGKIKKSESKRATYIVRPPSEYNLEIEYSYLNKTPVSTNIMDDYEFKEFKPKKNKEDSSQILNNPKLLETKKVYYNATYTQKREKIQDERPRLKKGQKSICYYYDKKLKKYVVRDSS